MIYTLNEDEDWTILYDSNEAGYLAIFPEYDLALLSLEWISDADGVDEIELENFLVDTIPLMLEQNIKIAVFPLNENVESIILDPIEFAKMINAHFSEWYSETFDLPYLS